MSGIGYFIAWFLTLKSARSFLDKILSQNMASFLISIPLSLFVPDSLEIYEHLLQVPVVEIFNLLYVEVEGGRKTVPLQSVPTVFEFVKLLVMSKFKASFDVLSSQHEYPGCVVNDAEGREEVEPEEQYFVKSR